MCASALDGSIRSFLLALALLALATMGGINGTRRLRRALVGGIFAGLVALPPVATFACPGDCDASGDVTVDEIVTLINMALGNVDVATCTAGDTDANGSLTVDEIIQALLRSLDGCPALTPTPPPPTPTATATATTTPTPLPPLFFSFDFRSGANGWTSGAADYPADQAAEFDLLGDIAPLPEETGIFGTGYLLGGSNFSDDLFLFIARRFGPAEGVRADQAYEVTFRIRFASNAPSGCPGIGGAPGESVFLKAGVNGALPETRIDLDGNVRMTVDKGNQSTGGPAASPAGNIANGLACDSVDPGDAPYRSVVRDHVHTALAVPDAAGDLWALVGIDSGFEGRTEIYFERVAVNLTPAASLP